MATDSVQDSISRFKNSFHAFSGLTHLNNAGIAPVSGPAREAVEFWVRKSFEEGTFSVFESMEQVDATRHDLAAFLGAKPEETAFFQSTASALSQVAFGMTLEPGNEILVWDQEYPSNFYPWKDAAERTGAVVKIAPCGPHLETPVELLFEQVTDRTRVISVSWVQFQTGAITDLKRLTAFARERGIFTVADIVQGAGLLPFNFHDIGLDAACGGSHKWFASPVSTGYLLLKEEHLERLSPIAVGAMTYGTPDDKTSLAAIPRRDAKRFEAGSKGVLEILGLGASLRLFRETGIERISQEIEWLSRKLLHGLRERGYIINTPHGAHHRGSIVNFSVGPDSPFKEQSEVETALLKNRVSFARRGPGSRLSPHAFNTEDDITRVLHILENR